MKVWIYEGADGLIVFASEEALNRATRANDGPYRRFLRLSDFARRIGISSSDAALLGRPAALNRWAACFR